MSKKRATKEIEKLIYELAGNPERAYAMRKPTQDMLRLGLKIYDICDAIREWIDAGKHILEDTTRHDPKFAGETIYIIEHCPVSSYMLYVKVQIRKNLKTGEYLMIISSHEPKH